jgi:RNA polymerase sigma-70 factor (sigma-E family)
MYAPGSTAPSIERSPGLEFEDYLIEARQRLYRFAVVLCGDTVLAGELLCDVLGRAFERWAQVSAADNPHAYVRRMLVNEFVSWQRRRARTIPHPEIGRLADLRADRSGDSGPDPGVAVAERSALLAELSRLPTRQRAAIVLRYYVDLSDEDIAAELGCRTGTVRSSISRGLATLRISRTSSDDDRTTS